MKRTAGILLPVTSLPSEYGIGCFDKSAYDFVDWLAKSGQRYWQILPLGATSHGGAFDSPYQAYSAFAGNPNLISLRALIDEGVLSEEECDAADFGSDPGRWITTEFSKTACRCFIWPTAAATSPITPNSTVLCMKTAGGWTIMRCLWQ